VTTRVLLVEDDEDFAFGVEHALRARDLHVRTVTTSRDALLAAMSEAYDVVLLDLGLPDAPGQDVLTSLLRSDPHAAVIVLTGRDDASTAVQALRQGAAHYLTKPVRSDDLLVTIEQACEGARLRRHVEAAARALRGEPADGRDDDAGIGRSPAWLAAVEAIRAAAGSPRTPVLVTGESGTGKERCARQVHAWSERASGPFVTVNAASLAPTLLESELFGHEAGAFTGARTTKRGVFELARGGTLFLDELGELPLELQPKLLRALDGHPIRRVGGERDVHVDVRVVSATNRDLASEVRRGRFRLDLYHRLRVIEVALPPLRERGDDVERLALHFVGRISREIGGAPPEVTARAMAALRAYDWPGNVRELRNVLERAIVLGRGAPIDVGHLPREIASSPPSPKVGLDGGATDPLVPLDEAVRAHVLRVFHARDGNVSQAARTLGISRNTLKRHLRDAGLALGALADG